MTWPIPTSGEAMVSLKGRVGNTRGRRRFKTSMNRKFERKHTFWVPFGAPEEAGTLTSTFSTQHPNIQSAAARRWICIRADGITFYPRGAGSDWDVEIQADSGREYSTVRKSLVIHRFEGKFNLDLSCMPDIVEQMEGAEWGGHNVTRLFYLWTMHKRRPSEQNYEDNVDSYGEEHQDMNISPFSTNVFWEWMRRRDIRKWGQVDVYGTKFPLDSLDQPATLHQFYGDRVGGSLPFPRCGKNGIVIPPGYDLSCWVTGRALPGVQQQNALNPATYEAGVHCRPVIGQPAMRMLCSLK